jgi:hypothetical protein
VTLRGDIPPALWPAIGKTQEITQAFLVGLDFIVKDTSRDPSFFNNHLLGYISQDLLQSSIALPVLVTEGLLNVARRELRFLVEAATKLCYVQQQQYSSSIAGKLSAFRKALDSASISLKNQLVLGLLPAPDKDKFLEEVGRLTGETSNYVHLTTTQIAERISMVDAGRTSGWESAEDIDKVNLLLERGLASTIVLLLHSVPDYVAGDLLVSENGDTINWYFTKSVYIAAIDSHFDYKHERQARLDEIRSARQARVAF